MKNERKRPRPRRRSAKKQQSLSLRQRVLELLGRNRKKPLRPKDLALLLKLSPKESKDLEELLSRLQQEGLIVRDQKGRLGLKDNMQLIQAKVVSVQERFGFARPLSEGATREDGIFLPGREMLGALPGDLVELRLSKDSKGKVEGVVTRILEQGGEPFSAVVQRRDGRWFVQADRDLRIPLEVEPDQLHGAQVGDKVLATVGKRGSGHFSHRARVLKTFGPAQLAANCCQAVLASHNARTTFPEAVREEAKQIEARGIPAEELRGRLDLRELPIFTIDGADTKDIDDAISLSREGDLWKLGVHIADVSHYVTPGSPLDQEAYARGTSVYYADQVLPMLPKELSNGICSLNPGEDRLAFSALLSITPQGQLQDYRFVKSVIRSRVKGVYSEVNALLAGEGEPSLQEKYAAVLPEIRLMKDFATLLRQKHFERGAMNISSVESKFIIEKGQVKDIIPRTQGESESFIEEFMLMANQAAATLAMKQRLPFVYRVHDTPPVAKVVALRQLLEQVGIPAAGLSDQPSAKELSDILESQRGTRLEQLVNNQLLRSMAKAVYSAQNSGHFGLVLENYSHFTSPIRRYPDLLIHRILSAYLAGESPKELLRRFGNSVGEQALHCSEMEQNAVSIERDCEDCYKAEYMASRVGQVFEGTISTVTAYGFYVELPNTVEGLVHIHSLPEGDYVLEEGLELCERLSGRRYKIGQPIPIQVARADVSAGEIDFCLPQEG